MLLSCLGRAVQPNRCFKPTWTAGPYMDETTLRKELWAKGGGALLPLPEANSQVSTLEEALRGAPCSLPQRPSVHGIGLKELRRATRAVRTGEPSGATAYRSQV